MTKEEIIAEIASYNDLIADPSVPQDEKDFAKGEIADLQKQLEEKTGAPKGKIHVVKPAAAKVTVKVIEENGKWQTYDSNGDKFGTPQETKAKAEHLINFMSDKAKGKKAPKAKPASTENKLTDLTSKESVAWRKESKKPGAWATMQEKFPRLKKFDGPKSVKLTQREKAETRPTYKYKGKTLKELTKEDCDELRKDVAERRKKSAKAEKKSKSKPVIEKIAANVATAVKQAVKNVSAADIKDNPKGEISKMERIEKAAKAFLTEMRSILGEDYDKESIDGEFKELHDMIKDLKKKYN